MPLQMLETCKAPATSSTNMRPGLIRLRRRKVGVRIGAVVQGLRMRARTALPNSIAAAIGACGPTRSTNAGRGRDCV